MIKLRFLIVVAIILVTGILLQAFNIINIAALFRINEREIEEVVEERVTSSLLLPERYEQYYILYNSVTADDERILYHLEQILRNAKIAYRPVDIGGADLLQTLQEGTPSDGYIIATAFLDQLSPESISELRALVEQGASLSILTGSSSPLFHALAGIEATLGSGWIPTEAISFTAGIFPLLDAIELEPGEASGLFPASHQQLAVSSRAAVIAEADDATPLIWRYEAGNGSVLYCNTTMFREKVNRGLLLQLLLQQDDFGLAYIQGNAMLSVDQLPGPVPTGRTPLIYDDYQRDNLKFFKEIWWTDIINMRDRLDLGLTGFALGSFDEESNIRIPEIDLDAHQAITVMGKLLSNADGELAIEGFTPAPLLTESDARKLNIDPPASGFWSGEEEMVRALAQFHEIMDEIFRPVTFLTFAASGGLYGELTHAAARSAFPELRIFSGPYTRYAEPEKARITEVELDSLDDPADSITLPRFSSGYSDDAATLWPMLNGIAELGVLNHVIGAMDLLNQPAGSQRRWNAMIRDLEELLGPVIREFPFLSGKTHIEAYIDFRKNEQMRCYTNRTADGITIQLENVYLPVSFYLYSRRAVSSVRGGIIQPLGSDGLYILEARKPDVSISLRK